MSTVASTRPLAILAALQKLADDARTSGDEAAPRYEAILWQVKPLASSLQFGKIIIHLGRKEDCEVAAAIAKMSKFWAPISFHLYIRSTPLQHSAVSLRGFPSCGLHERSRSSTGWTICFNCGDPGHFHQHRPSSRLLSFFAIKYGLLIILLLFSLFVSFG